MSAVTQSRGVKYMTGGTANDWRYDPALYLHRFFVVRYNELVHVRSNIGRQSDRPGMGAGPVGLHIHRSYY